MKHKIQWCYLCRATEELTSDHVPPKNLFLEPRPSNLITVPCCRRCNSSWQLLDEEFRAFITTPANVSETGKTLMRTKVFDGSFKRSPALKSKMKQGVDLVKLGTITVPVISVDKGRFDPFFVRITKGLLATFEPETDYFQSIFEVFQLSQFGGDHPTFRAQIKRFDFDERGAGVFRSWRIVRKENGQPFGLWLYQFYDAGLFMVKHRSPGQQ